MGLTPGTSDRGDGWRRRILFLTAAAMMGFVVLLGQLWYLQNLEGGKLQAMSDKNRIRIRPVAAPRGIGAGAASSVRRGTVAILFSPSSSSDRSRVSRPTAPACSTASRWRAVSLSCVASESENPAVVQTKSSEPATAQWFRRTNLAVR